MAMMVWGGCGRQGVFRISLSGPGTELVVFWRDSVNQ